MPSSFALLIGTRKGAFILRSDPARRVWTMSEPMFLGQVVHHVVLDPRDRRTLLMAAKPGHLGPTVFRSTDRSKTWKEAVRPPAFPKAPEGQTGLSVAHVFWLTPGHPTQPGVWYSGTSPQGLFRSSDGGETWDGVAGFNSHPKRSDWVGRPEDAPPDGATLHSINIDPRDPRHMYIGLSSGGVFESRDGGKDWAKRFDAGSRVIVHIASPLRSYTGSDDVHATGATLSQVLDDLDRRYPGIRFRMIDEQGAIREHIRLFVGGELTQDLNRPLHADDEVHILCAISGGSV